MKLSNVFALALALLLLPVAAGAQQPPPTETRLTFLTAKLYTDGNENPVDVTLSCNTGLPLDQTTSVDPLNAAIDWVDFVIVDFDSGELICDVTEDVPDGYSPLYIWGVALDGVLPVTIEGAQALAAESQELFQIGGIDDESCGFLPFLPDENQIPVDFWCLIVNIPDPVDVDITKTWVLDLNENAPLNGVSTEYQIKLECDGPILAAPGAAYVHNYGGDIIGSGYARWEADTSNDRTFSAEVRPDEFGENECTVYETVFDSAVEVDNDCGEFDIDVGGGPYECTITNTVFFEGIPTLSQYGLAMLALLLLGVGFVGFRRLV